MLWIFIFTLLSGYTFSQEKKKEDSIKLQIECGKSLVNDLLDLNFRISLINSSEESINIPQEYLAVPYKQSKHFAYFWYEVQYCNKEDTLNSDVSLLRAHIWKKDTSIIRISLHPNDVFYINAQVSDIYFSKPGTYRVRFILAKELFKNHTEDVFSDWFYTELKKDISKEF